jgi:hypothetical protein
MYPRQGWSRLLAQVETLRGELADLQRDVVALRGLPALKQELRIMQASALATPPG